MSARDLLIEFTRRMEALAHSAARSSVSEVSIRETPNAFDFVVQNRPRVAPLPPIFSAVPEDRTISVEIKCPTCLAYLPAGRSCRRCVDVKEST